ncbi:type VI secretion system-associated protein TagF [Variovorax paradoxus]|uniref:type VI secretion system-associated protein TagF n=1 Tax=Variovorax paradoxus TaxID=34073 RepID=UPI003D6589F0
MTGAVAFSAAALPGWFGKLPGMGDFAHRRLPESFRSEWDHWLQRGLARLKDRHEDWIAHYLQAPVWCFALGPGVAGQGAWIGVMMPSVDGVGRYFPITLAVEFDAPVGDALQGDALRGVLLWWERGTQAALEGLEGDMDALGFDALLERLFVATQGGGGREGGGGVAGFAWGGGVFVAWRSWLWRGGSDGCCGVAVGWGVRGFVCGG